MSKKSDSIYLLHIKDACKKIISYIKGVEKSDFLSNSLLQDGVIRELEIIGEAAKHLTTKFVESNKDTDWVNIRGMRNVIIHEYFQVDLDIVWTTVKKDIPDLLIKVEKILNLEKS